MWPFSNISSAWHRLRIRKLYNSSRWEEARIHSLPLLSCEINGEFAQNIVIRSLWNLHRYEETIDFALQYPSENTRRFSEKSKQRMGLGVDSLPSIHQTTEWNGEELLANWFQEGVTVWLRHPWGWSHWVMPKGYVLSNTHPSLLALAMDVLLKPWLPEIGEIVTEKRNFGEELALSYSGGTDSAAAGILLPDDTILSYHERNFPSMLSHELPRRLFERLRKKNGREVLCIPSNHERIRTFHGKPNGFSTDYAAGVHLILLADHLNLKGIAFGTPIDNTWLEKGRRFRDFSESWHWKHWREKFAHTGLHLELPINHISEAGALRICQQSNLANDINSCLRSIDGRGCQKCWKCFHKNGPLGRPMNPESVEIQKFLKTRPLRTAQHALWAIQVQNLEKMVPHLSAELANPLDWWELAYSPGIDLISEPWRATVKERTEQMIAYMESPELLQEVDLFPDSWK